MHILRANKEYVDFWRALRKTLERAGSDDRDDASGLEVIFSGRQGDNPSRDKSLAALPQNASLCSVSRELGAGSNACV
jgi:hypothetical protein